MSTTKSKTRKQSMRVAGKQTSPSSLKRSGDEKERWTLEMSEGAQRQGDSLATLFKAKEGLPSGQGVGAGILESPGNKLTGMPSPALRVAASLRLSTPILQSPGLTRGPGWDSGCVRARAKEQLQGSDRRVGEVRGGGRSVNSGRCTGAGRLGRTGTEVFFYFSLPLPTPKNKQTNSRA